MLTMVIFVASLVRFSTAILMTPGAFDEAPREVASDVGVIKAWVMPCDVFGTRETRGGGAKLGSVEQSTE